MSNKIVTVGIWNGAPFGGSIISGIERLNEFLKSEKLAVHYEPVRIDSQKLPKASKLPDIIVFDGGEDINPERYGQRNTYSSFSEIRDRAEFKIMDYFQSYGKRISGVCRGHQLINVHLGGSLLQDIRQSGLFTDSALSYHKGGHKVRLKRQYPKYLGSKKGRKKGHTIARFVGENPFTVSSMHHQAIHQLGDHLGVSLSFGNHKRGRHYIVEGIESADGRIRGLQSHPEFNGYPKDGALFSYLLHVDVFVDNLFEPDLEEIKKRLETERPAKKQQLPFDMANRPPRRGDSPPLRLRGNPPQEQGELNEGDAIVRNPTFTRDNVITADTGTFIINPDNGTDDR